MRSSVRVASRSLWEVASSFPDSTFCEKANLVVDKWCRSNEPPAKRERKQEMDEAE